MTDMYLLAALIACMGLLWFVVITANRCVKTACAVAQDNRIQARREKLRAMHYQRSLLGGDCWQG